MHIKKVIIEGFKSYRSQLDMEQFHPRINIVVGRNGSGKSNFFDAISFVLGDLFTNIRAEDRQKLLHGDDVGDQSGPQTASVYAYVEIYFDNTDHQLPIDHDEVVLRRQIGRKKDEYFIDRKHVTKNDVINILEAAGFSRSNPYYIVKQGKVQALATMRESERLELLKEVAGTRVYDERREESRKIMEETKGRKEKIGEVLTYIQERLDELSEEKEELKQYSELDSKRRAVEYSLYNKELEAAESRLLATENERREKTTESESLVKAVKKHETVVKEHELEAKKLDLQIRQLTKEKEQLAAERQELLKREAGLDLDVIDAGKKLQGDKESRVQIERELAEVEARIKETNKALTSLRQEFEKARDAENELRDSINEKERRIKELFSKQGRSSRFNNQKERDAWIKEEVKDLRDKIKNKQGQINALGQELKDLEKSQSTSTSNIKDRVKEQEQKTKLLETIGKDLGKLKEQRDDLNNKRKELWKKESELNTHLATTKQNIQRFDKQLSTTMPRALSQGLRSVREIVHKHNISGVFGPLIDLFACPPDYVKAAEVTGGNSLFDIVVDTEETVSQILEHFQREKAPGRVTFMPLNRLHVKENVEQSLQAKPLIAALEFDEKYQKAFSQIFGRTLVCANLNVAAALAFSQGCNCITLEGQQVNRKGAYTGGFIDENKYRISAAQGLREQRRELEKATAQSNAIKAQIDATDRDISRILGEAHKKEADREQTKKALEQIRIDLQQLAKEQEKWHGYQEQKERAIQVLSSTQKELEDQAASLTTELATPMAQSLSKEEQDQLQKLSREVNNEKNNLIKLSGDRIELEAKKDDLENKLASNLEKRKSELSQKLQSLNANKSDLQDEGGKQELSRAREAKREVEERLEVLTAETEEKTAELSQLRTQIDNAKKEESTATVQLHKQAKTMERLLNKRVLALQKRDEYARKLAELAGVPRDVAAYADYTIEELMEELHEVNNKLKSFNHVNKKANDQYVNFTEQRKRLDERRTELDQAESAIELLIQKLDQEKDAAIERTFKMVALHFKNVFNTLVPNGEASLVMVTKKKSEGEEASQPRSQSTNISQITGVKMNATFPAQKRHGIDEPSSTNLLSGGQKSLAALALIFAIQYCDPAPFYLFDEIDAALDPAYRTAVAELIENMSKEDKEAERPPVQFIIATFNQEMLDISRKFFMISSANRVSSIRSVTAEDARRIMQAEQEHRGKA